MMKHPTLRLPLKIKRWLLEYEISNKEQSKHPIRLHYTPQRMFFYFYIRVTSYYTTHVTTTLIESKKVNAILIEESTVKKPLENTHLLRAKIKRWLLAAI